MTEVHKERNDFEKMKKEDLISECLKWNKFLLQLKDENDFLRQQNNKMVDKINVKTSNQIHDNNKVQQHQQQTKIFIQSLYQDQQRHIFFRIVHTKKYKQKI